MKTYLVYILLGWFVAINIFTFICYGIDKWKAQRNKWRVNEATLIWLAVIGGSIGAWAGMKIWRHKTQHPKFKYGIPAILLSQIAVVGAIAYYCCND